MSEITKPVEAPVEAPVLLTEAPVIESKPTETMEEPTTETTPAVEPATEEAVAEPVKEEVKPVEEGVLGYKGPGLLKSFMFQKKFFYFGTEPVEHKNLSSYLRGEKAQDTAISNAAWASHTGEGLLFFSKKHTDKATPAGIFNLSEVSEVLNDGLVDFTFVSGGHKHTFQAATPAERNNWVSVLKTKMEEAKTLAPTVAASDKYKDTHSSLSKPAVVAAAVLPKKSVEKAEAKEEKKEEKAEAKEEKKEEKAEAKEEKKEEKSARKSRSASRKRNSIFGSFMKKEDKTEAAKEETPAVAPTIAETGTAPVVDEPVVEQSVPETAVPETTESTSQSTPVVAENKPLAIKRNSIFGTLKSQFSAHKVAKTEHDAPAVPAKDAVEPVADNAPVIPAVESTEPLAAAVASPATVPTETTELPITNGEAKTETPVVKTDKRKSSLPWMTKKDKPVSDDEVTEKPKSPFAKLRATVKGKTSKAVEKPTETPATEAPVEETPAVSEPVISEPEPVIPTTTTQVAASA